MEIIIKNLQKSYDGAKVLENFSLTLSRNEPVCLMGASGKGKTTLFNILTGLIQPDSGEITGLKDIGISAVFQEDRLCEDLSAVMNVAVVMGSPDRDVVKKELMAVGLAEEEIIRPVSSLSGGQKRRVAIVRALMYDGDRLFMDEPFKGLDEDTKDKVISVVNEKTKGKAVLVITHDREDREKLGAKIVNL